MDEPLQIPFITWHHHLNYLMHGVRCGPLDTSRNWSQMIVRSTVGRNGHPPRFYSIWLEDVNRFSPDLHEAMYSHLLGDVDGNLLPEDARMGYDMRTRTFPVLAGSSHRMASLSAELQPLCLVASREYDGREII